MNERQRRREEAVRRKAEAKARKLEARQKRADSRRARTEARIGPTIHPGVLEAEPVFGGEAYVVDLGPRDAPAVVLVHGVGDNAARDWDGLIPALAGSHRVVAFDLPGFGRSTKANAAYKPGAYVKFIERVAGARLGRPFSLIGHSMGGAIALAYAGANPKDVERLIVADAAGILHRHAFGEYALSLGIRGVPGWDAVTEHPIGAALGDVLSGIAEGFAHKLIRPYFSVEPDPSTLFELAAVRERVLGGDPLKIAGLFLITENFGPAIAAVAAPPLLIWGEEDRIAPLRTGLLLCSMIPGSRLELLAGCGHVPMRERPERFNELVLEWLESPPRARERKRARAPVSGPEERLTRVHGRELGGERGRLIIEDCEGVALRGVRAQSVVIRRSAVEMEGCDVDGEGIGLDVEDARVKVTGGSIRGEVAIRTESSDLDLAGTEVDGRAAAVRSAVEAEVLFSVCPVRSPRSSGFLHGVYRVGAAEEI